MARNSGEIDIRALAQSFITSLVAAVEQNTAKRIESALLDGVGVAPRRGPGRPPKNGLFALSSVKRSTRPRVKQLCPVPGCKNPAAPVFGMVCAKHKDIAKAKIKEYRDARRRAKVRAAGRPRNGADSARSRPRPAPKRRKPTRPAAKAAPRPAPKPAPAPAATAAA